MCEDTIACLKKAKKKAVRTMERILNKDDMILDLSDLEKLHHAVDIIKVAEKFTQEVIDETGADQNI